MRFEDLELIEPVLKALDEKGYTEPTPIQAAAIPQILKKKDILGCAQTGTGKTAAFAIPIIQLIQQGEALQNNKVVLQSLIITPTRELAIQIGENIESYAKFTEIRHTVIFGGVKQGSQVAKLKRGVHILIATPGRLLDLIDQGYINLSQINLFVLDEADRMLDMGFINDIRKVLKLLPEKRQSLFFSATLPQNIVELSQKILTNPTKIEVTPPSSTAETIKQYLYYTNRTAKKDLLIHLLEKTDIDHALIFTRTKRGADRVAKILGKNNIKSAAIHGDKAQNQRQKALSQFKEGKIRVLVATDIAARGIDIDKLKFVINYEIPNLPETYVHRIGRSGRAGETGVSISMSEPEENAYVKDINKLIGKDKLIVVEDNPFPQTDKPMTPAEKKEWEKEKNRRKQEFFANRKDKRGGRGASAKTDKKRPAKKEKPSNGREEPSGKREQPSGRREEHSAKKHKPRAERGDAPKSDKPKQNNKSGNHKGKKRKAKPEPKTTGPRNRRVLPAKLEKKYMWPLE